MEHTDGIEKEVGLSPVDFVLGRDPAPSPKMGWSPQFQDHVYYGQTAGWIKMALEKEVGLGPGHIVLDGDPAPFPKKGQTPNFRPIFTFIYIAPISQKSH